MARKSRKSNNTGIWVLGIIVVAAIVLFSMGIPQETIGDGVKVDTKDCENAPTVDANYYEKGTGDSISSVDTYAIVDARRAKNISASDTFQLGSSFKLMGKKDNYLNDVVVESGTFECGVNALDAELWATSTPTFNLKDTSGTDLSDDATGGSNNLSSSSSTIEYNGKIGITVDEATGDMVLVVEASDDSVVDDISLSGPGVSETSTPETYSVQSTNSVVQAFEISSIEDGASEDFTMKLYPKSGETISDVALYHTGYTEQYDVDTDGSFIKGVEDSDGDNIYEDTFSHNAYVAA